MRGRLIELALAASVGVLLGASAVGIVKHEEVKPGTTPPQELVDSQHALQLCRQHGVAQGGGDAELRAAFESTAGEIADWMLGGPPDEPKGLNQFIEERLRIGREMPVAICYFDRDAGYYPSIPPGYDGPPINRVRVLVDKDGGSVTDTVGSQGSADHPGMRLIRPNEGPRNG